MGFLHNLKLWLSPLRMTDPDFGTLLFMRSSKAPERSYWECEWIFPATGTVIAIALPGGEGGPMQEARHFYLDLPHRFAEIMVACRPGLEQVLDYRLHQRLPADIFTVAKVSGFGLGKPRNQPPRWEITFETIGKKWLGITIPFVGDTAMEAVVDT